MTLRHVPLVASGLLASIALGHPGNGIVVLPDGSVITGDAVRNGVWKFSAGRRPQQVVSSFHCHWVVAGQDGKVYAETVAERGGNWFSTHYRLDLAGGSATRLGSDVAGDASRFAVDRQGARVFYSDRRFIRASSTGSSPFRKGGSLARGESALGSIAAFAWGPDDALYMADDNRVRAMDRSGVIRTVVTLRGSATLALMGSRSGQRRIWGLDVTPSGDILIADASTEKVLRVRNGRETVISQARDGWVATGVAASGTSIYLLETKQVGTRSLGPRVRKISGDGSSETLGTVEA